MSLSIQDYNGPKIPNYISGTLAANDMRGITAVGARFYVIESDGELTIKTNNGNKATFTARQGEFADPSALYERIEIYNETGAPIVFRIFYGFGDFIDGTSEVIGTIEVTSSALPTGASTSAKQDAQTALLTTIDAALADVSTETTLAAVLAKIIAAPATEAKQDTGNASLAAIDANTADVATETTLAAVLAALASVAVTGPLTDVQLRASAVPTTRSKVGAQANAWNAAAVGAGGTSASIDAGSLSSVSAFGTVDAATTITVQVSEDNAAFYDTATTAVLGGAGDFHVSLETGARYIRLKSSGAATITATVSAKG